MNEPTCRVCGQPMGAAQETVCGINGFVHSKCHRDVYSGWSGGMMPSGMSYEECYRLNWKSIGIDYPEAPQ